MALRDLSVMEISFGPRAPPAYTALHKPSEAGRTHDKRVENRRRRRYIAAMATQSASAHGHGAAHDGLTPGRRRILGVLEKAGQPLGAYEMIDLIAAETGKRPAPVSIYRALDFLVEHGLAHRLASRNAFMACGHGHGDADPVAFLICDSCGSVEERTSESMRRSLDAVAGAAGFAPRDRVIEVTGTCATCRSAA
jgi:Fur family zinc uptake transcriptional regulator